MTQNHPSATARRSRRNGRKAALKSHSFPGHAIGCRSLELSARQGTRAWALRAAIDLAELFIDHEQPERARALLLPIFEQFQEGLDTLDLKVAEQLLVGLGLTQAGRADQSDPANLKFARA